MSTRVEPDPDRGIPIGRLHLITDSRPGADPVAQVKQALTVATQELCIQFRPADEWTDRLVFDLATEIVSLARAYRIPVLINDRVHIALAVGADGAHVGADDLPVAAARRLLGPDRTLGATARNVGAAQRAKTDGADYVGVGPCFQSSTKDGLPDPLGPSLVGDVAREAGIPVIAIGGIQLEHVANLRQLGVHGVAVIGAVADAPDQAKALASLLDQVR